MAECFFFSTQTLWHNDIQAFLPSTRGCRIYALKTWQKLRRWTLSCGLAAAVKGQLGRCNMPYAFNIYIYIWPQAIQWLTFSTSSSMVDNVLRVLQLGLEGARNNWWSLGCPAYCVQPPLSLLALTFLLGFVSGTCTTCFALWTLWTWISPAPASPAQPVSVSSRYSALAEYAHEPQPTKRRAFWSAVFYWWFACYHCWASWASHCLVA